MKRPPHAWQCLREIKKDVIESKEHGHTDETRPMQPSRHRGIPGRIMVLRQQLFQFIDYFSYFFYLLSVIAFRKYLQGDL